MDNMITVVGVRLRVVGRLYYFLPGEEELKRGTTVVVDTVRGLEIGTVIIPPMEIEKSKVKEPVKPVLRVATAEDKENAAKNRAQEKTAIYICKEKIRNHDLSMKLIDAEYTLDQGKLIFYFTADSRVDFRELVKDLAGSFKTRIELRQVGVRDETRILGGMGICGRTLCCHTFLTNFQPVSIKMAKEQNISLNPSKISGTCGRLMCCLKNEEEVYEELNKTMPRLNDDIVTVSGLHGYVQSLDVLHQKVRIIVEKENDNKELMEIPVSEIASKTKGVKRGKLVKPIPVTTAKSDIQMLEEEIKSGELSKADEREILKLIDSETEEHFDLDEDQAAPNVKKHNKKDKPAPKKRHFENEEQLPEGVHLKNRQKKDFKDKNKKPEKNVRQDKTRRPKPNHNQNQSHNQAQSQNHEQPQNAAENSTKPQNRNHRPHRNFNRQKNKNNQSQDKQ